MTMLDGKCDCCDKNPPIGVACIPGIPVSIAWCGECLQADVIPFWAAASNTACIGGLEGANAHWKQLVSRTIKYHGKSQAEFDELVQQMITDLSNYDPQAHDAMIKKAENDLDQEANRTEL